MGNGKYNRKKNGSRQQARGKADNIPLANAKEADADQEREPSGNPRRQPQDVEKPTGWIDDLGAWAKNEKSFTDWSIALFTFVLAAAAIYQFIIMGGQLDAMRIDQRAWLQIAATPDSQKPDMTTLTFTAGQPVTYPIHVLNVGKTPAQNVVVKLFVDIVPSGEEPPLDRVDSAVPGSAYPFNLMETGIIFPNSDLKMVADRALKGGTNRTATSDEVNAIREGTARLTVYGIVRYDDVFGKPHWTKWCTEFPVIQSGTRGCAHYNSAN